MTSKEQEQIYNALKSRSIKVSSFFGRELVTVNYSDFKEWEKSFSVSKNPLDRGEHFRSARSIKHIHATRKGELVKFHYDYGNPNENNPLLIFIHFFIDVIPYFAWHLISWKKPYTISKD